MFTGIIESTGVIESVEIAGSNRSFWIKSPFSGELKPDQSLAHDGACLTVEEIKGGLHKVTAVQETLNKTTLGSWEKGREVNLERCLRVNARLDGHFVQGHVDTVAECIAKESAEGSWEFRFRFDEAFAPLLVEKGSIAVNGISLTVFDLNNSEFSVAIIPYTYTHTTMKELRNGMPVNLEFDLMGKYIQRYLSLTKH